MVQVEMGLTVTYGPMDKASAMDIQVPPSASSWYESKIFWSRSPLVDKKQPNYASKIHKQQGGVGEKNASNNNCVPLVSSI